MSRTVVGQCDIRVLWRYFSVREGDMHPEEWGDVAGEDEEEPGWDAISEGSEASSVSRSSVGLPESCFSS